MCEDCNEAELPAKGDTTILIHACAKIATVFPCISLRSTSVLIHACARIATAAGEAGGTRPVLIHACAKIATSRRRRGGGQCVGVLIHACARIAIGYWTHLGLGVAYFNSCMREDCNLQIPKRADRIWYFDSCMREDCNSKYAQISALISVHSYDFFLNDYRFWCTYMRFCRTYVLYIRDFVNAMHPI